MIIALFGILDIIAGGALLLGTILGLPGSEFLFWFTILFFLKGLYSVGTALAAGFFMDFMGYLDLLGALFLLLLYWGIAPGWVFWIGLLILIKGVYSFIIAFISN
ncbi:MAG: hypothetical protein HY520_02895 [Candidatus Aenigmarchaeota archaeon]|nr:hypothetical protein [Candidatus Aenigmarchaeota archaeon]